MDKKLEKSTLAKITLTQTATPRSTILGKKGEDLVSAYLIKNGFKILEKNYRKRQGEIDIIAEKNSVRAFVEVKLRNHKYFAVSQVITKSKQRKIITTALIYNSERSANNEEKDLIFRFDVAIVEQHQDEYVINYIKNAFTSQNQF